MAEEVLKKAGLNIDDLNNFRLLEPDVQQQSSELRDSCKEFMDKIESFHKIVSSLIEVMDSVAKEVQKEKMKAIGSRNLLMSVTKQREEEQIQLMALITEKKMQMERLRIQHEALLKHERDQNDFIEQFMLQK